MPRGVTPGLCVCSDESGVTGRRGLDCTVTAEAESPAWRRLNHDPDSQHLGPVAMPD